MLHTLLMSMGKKFKVLIQQKGLQNPVFSGLNFVNLLFKHFLIIRCMVCHNCRLFEPASFLCTIHVIYFLT